jgi:hypothetical protein
MADIYGRGTGYGDLERLQEYNRKAERERIERLPPKNIYSSRRDRFVTPEGGYGQIDATTGAPADVRLMMGAIDKPEDRLRSMQAVYGENVVRDPNDPNNFLFINPDTGLWTVAQPPGLDPLDVVGAAREGAHLAGAVIGSAAGTAVAPGIGTAVGTAGGAAVAETAFQEMIRRAFPNSFDSRTTGEKLMKAGEVAAMETLGRFGGAVLGAGVQGTGRQAFRGRPTAGGVRQRLRDAGKVMPGARPLASSIFPEGAALGFLEDTFARLPGGAGVIKRRVAHTRGVIADVLEGKARRQADLNPAPIGKRIARGVRGHVDAFTKQSNNMYAALRRNIGEETVGHIDNTKRVINELATLVPEDKALNQLFSNPLLLRTSKAIRGKPPTVTQRPLYAHKMAPQLNETYWVKQINHPSKPLTSLSYGSLENIRKEIGRRISDPLLMGDISTGQLKQLYKAVTDDMLAIARSGGNEAQFLQVNKHYRLGRAEIDKVLDPIVKQNIPEQVFEALNKAAAGSQVTSVQAIRKAVGEDAWDVVVPSIIRRFGRQNIGEAFEEGGEFSMEKYITAWGKMDEPTKKALFSDAALRGHMDALQRTLKATKEGGGVGLDVAGATGGIPSVGRIGIGAGVAGTTGAAAYLGGPLLAGVVLSTLAGSANLGARLMSRPAFVNWLAKSTRVKPQGFGAHIGLLAGAASDPESEDVLEFLSLLEGNIDTLMEASDEELYDVAEAPEDAAPVSFDPNFPPSDRDLKAGLLRLPV